VAAGLLQRFRAFPFPHRTPPGLPLTITTP